jgi:hypothetical protein
MENFGIIYAESRENMKRISSMDHPKRPIGDMLSMSHVLYMWDEMHKLKEKVDSLVTLFDHLQHEVDEKADK